VRKRESSYNGAALNERASLFNKCALLFNECARLEGFREDAQGLRMDVQGFRKMQKGSAWWRKTPSPTDETFTGRRKSTKRTTPPPSRLAKILIA